MTEHAAFILTLKLGFAFVIGLCFLHFVGYPLWRWLFSNPPGSGRSTNDRLTPPGWDENDALDIPKTPSAETPSREELLSRARSDPHTTLTVVQQWLNRRS